MDDAAHQFRLKLLARQSSKSFKFSKSGGIGQNAASIAPSEATVWVVKSYPPWQVRDFYISHVVGVCNAIWTAEIHFSAIFLKMAKPTSTNIPVALLL